jgi:hypothetical protein
MGSDRKTSRREFLIEAAATGAVFPFSLLSPPPYAFAQTPNRSRVTVAHGVGIYSLNPYAVNTSPLQAIWQSIMEPLRARGILANEGQQDRIQAAQGHPLS